VTRIDPERAVTSVVSAVLLVAVVVVLVATISTYVFGLSERIEEPAPTVGQSSGELVRDVAGGDDQIVRLEHVAGDTLRIADLEIVVDATDACGKRGRLVDLPDNAVGYGTPDAIEGDDIFDDSSPDGGQLDTSADGAWTAGETARFRLASSDCRLESGDSITVRVVHRPTGAVVVRETLVAS